MYPPTTLRRRVFYLIACLAVTIWGLVGLVQRPGRGWGGFVYNLDYIVEGVEPDGPADQAGLRAGDRVIDVAGIPVEDLPLYSRWPRALAPRAGEILQLQVERGGSRVAVHIVYGPSNIGMLHIGAAFIGLAFMVFGLWALFTAPIPAGRTLGSIGLAAGLATFGAGGPYLGTWDGLMSHLQFASGALWSLLMLRFFLRFPHPKRAGRSRAVTIISYALWGSLVASLILELLAHPRFYHTFGSWGALLIFIFLFAAFVAMIHTIAILDGSQRRATGMNLILWGMILAVVGVVVTGLTWALRLQVPGSQYLALLITAIPLTMALAVRRQAQEDGL